MRFGSGYVLGGTHPQIKAEPVSYSSTAALWRSANFLNRAPKRINHCQVAKPIISSNVCICNAVHVTDFMEAEAVGVNVPRKCKRCQDCPQCVFADNCRTMQEQLELQLLRDAVSYDEEKGVIKCSYPIVGDLSKFENNFEQVKTKAEANWRSLARKGHLEAYSAQIKDYVDRGVIKEVSMEEVKRYQDSGGTVHFEFHHGVLNDHSKSTPLYVW